jgi:hypothetical protein
MNRRTLFQTLGIAALVLAAGAVIAIGAYNAGVAHGIAESGRAIAAVPPGAPYVYGWPRPWGFGFFPFFPLFFFLFFFVVMRGLFWRGPWRGWGPRYDGIPPAFEEWHRRAHAERPTPAPGTGSTS